VRRLLTRWFNGLLFGGCLKKIKILLTLLLSLIALGLLQVSFAEVKEPDTSFGKTALHCQQFGDSRIRCSSGLEIPSLDIGFEIFNEKQQVFEINKITNSGSGFVFDSGNVCGKINVELVGRPGGVELSTNLACSTPLRMCVNAKVSGKDLDFSTQVSVVRSGNFALGVQADEKLGTEVDSAKKVIRSCTNPVYRKNIDWSLRLFSGSVNEVKKEMQSIPAPIFNGSGNNVGFSKLAPVVKDGYLFVDATEGNYLSAISYAKKSGFPFMLIYGSTWATTYGSYGFNKKNYPLGINGLKSVVGAANAQGVKVGLHLLTSFISKTDPYISNGNFDGLLKDDQTFLYRKVGSGDVTLYAGDSISTFPDKLTYYGNTKGGLDLLIDKEIIRCVKVLKLDRGVFDDCKRGLYGTVPVSHEQGAKLFHLAERYGSYLADLNKDIKSLIGDRVSGVVNDAGIDMIYFDGGEVGSANGSPGWYVAEQQIDILKKVKRPLLVEGSGIVPRLWPYLTRVVADDFAALSPLAHLDVYKIGRIHPAANKIFIPDNLGWIALLKETPAYPPTTPEEMSTYVARSLSLDVPLSIETRMDYLENNPYTSKLLNILSVGNRIIQSGELSLAQRESLGKGGWYYDEASSPELKKLRKTIFPISSLATTTPLLKVDKGEGGLIMRIRKVNSLEPHRAGNSVLLNKDLVVSAPPVINSENRGVLANSIVFKNDPSVPVESSFVNFVDNSPANISSFNLTDARSMSVEFDYGDGAEEGACSVINLQLQDNVGQLRDYFLYLSKGKNQRKTLDFERSSGAILTDFFPAPSNYAFKAAVYGFNFSAVTKLNVRWMRSCGENFALKLKKVEMLKEVPSVIKDVKLNVNGKKYFVSASVGFGETLDVFPNGAVWTCKGGACVKSSILWPSGKQLSGTNISIDYVTDGSAELSIGLLGEGVPVGN